MKDTARNPGRSEEDSFWPLSGLAGWPFPTLDTLYARIRPGFSLDFPHDLGPGSESSGPQCLHLYMGSIGKNEQMEVCASLPCPEPSLSDHLEGTLATFPPAIGCPV